MHLFTGMAVVVIFHVLALINDTKVNKIPICPKVYPSIETCEYLDDFSWLSTVDILPFFLSNPSSVGNTGHNIKHYFPGPLIDSGSSVCCFPRQRDASAKLWVGLPMKLLSGEAGSVGCTFDTSSFGEIWQKSILFLTLASTLFGFLCHAVEAKFKVIQPNKRTQKKSHESPPRIPEARGGGIESRITNKAKIAAVVRFVQ